MNLGEEEGERTRAPVSCRTPHPKPRERTAFARAGGGRGATASEQLLIREGPSESGKQEGHLLCRGAKGTEGEGWPGVGVSRVDLSRVESPGAPWMLLRKTSQCKHILGGRASGQVGAVLSDSSPFSLQLDPPLPGKFLS